MKKRAVLTVFALLLASMMLFASCAPTGTNGAVTTQGDTNPATLPEQPGDQTPTEQKVTVEYSLLMSGPTFVTWNADGQRQKEFGFTSGITFNYIYNTQKVLSAIQLTAEGETVEFECQYDDNGVPTKAVPEEDALGVGSFLFEYDSNKKMTKMTVAAMGGEMQFASFYDENGRTAKTELGEIATMLFEYSGDNVSLVKMMMGEENTVMAQLTFTYGEDGQLARMESQSADEDGIFVTDEYTEFTHTETSHTVKYYSIESSEEKLYSTMTYDADWNQTENLLYNEEGKVVSKDTVSYDKDGNKVSEQYRLEGDTLVLAWKQVKAFNSDGSTKWMEHYYQNEDGEVALFDKIIYTENGYEETQYGSDGKAEYKYVSTKDEQGNTLFEIYCRRENSDELYRAESGKDTPDGDMIEKYTYDPEGNVQEKMVRRDKTGGGYYIDVYMPNENDELILVDTMEYDENDELVTDDDHQTSTEEPTVTGPEGSVPGGGNDSTPEEEETGIKNDGANTEAGWGPIVQ